MRGASKGSPATAAKPPPDDTERFIGIFLMALWSVAMIVFTGDLAASGGVPCDMDACAWSGLSGIHAAMQAILFLVALGVGGAGAGLWFDSERPQRGP